MKRMILMTVVGLMIGSVALAGEGRPQGKPVPKRKVDTKVEKRHDKNQDGVIGKREAAHLKRDKERADQNDDGTVDAAERKQARVHKKGEVDTRLEKKYDADGDGRLSQGERDALRADQDTDGDGKVTRAEVVDRNDDGEIDAKERADAIEKARKVNTPREEHFDANNDGVIDADEAKTMNAWKRHVDQNHDGQVDHDELETFLEENGSDLAQKHPRMDTNHDGTIDVAEFEQARRVRAHRSRGQGSGVNDDAQGDGEE